MSLNTIVRYVNTIEEVKRIVNLKLLLVVFSFQNATTDLITLDEYLSRFQQTEYPLDILLARPLPETVNSTQLEKYLNDDDFEKALGMNKEEFKKLPLWKRTNLKKENGLF